MDARKIKHNIKGPFSIFNCFGMVNLLLLPSDLKKKGLDIAVFHLSWFSCNSHVTSRAKWSFHEYGKY